MTFTNIKKTTDPNTDFWELNPQLQYISPFNKLKDAFDDSSQHMWAIFFMSDPDEEVNKFYRYDMAQRKAYIKNFYEDIKWEDPLFKECLDVYPTHCMSAVKRVLKLELDSLRERAKLFQEPPTLDYTDPLSGRIIKGTALQLETMRKNTSKIYEQLEEAMQKFEKEKEDDRRVHGGRKESPSERGLL